MNSSQFSDLIKDKIGDFLLIQPDPDCYVYKLLSSDVSYEASTFSIRDRGMDGISVQFPFTYNSTCEGIDHIYHWADAYDLLAIALFEPQKLQYRDELCDTVSIPKTLNREPYDFDWPGTYLNIFDNDAILCGLKLISYGYIEFLNPEKTENGDVVVNPYAKIDPCSADRPWDMLLTGVKYIFSQEQEHSEDGITVNGFKTDGTLGVCGKNTEGCDQERCIIRLCAYLEYAAHNDILYEVLQKRKQPEAACLIPSGPYKFTWWQDTWLKLIDESRFNLALQMVNNNLIAVDKELDSDNRISINYMSGCGYTPRLTAFLAEIENADSKTQVKIPVLRSSTAREGENCSSCDLQEHCVLVYAGYIQYLRDCGKEKVIEEDREWFRQHKRESEKEMEIEFDYTLPTDLFMNAPEKLLEVAEMLQERNYVSIGTELQYCEGDGDSIDIPSEDSYYYCEVEAEGDVNVYDDVQALKNDILAGNIIRDDIPVFYAIRHDEYDSVHGEQKIYIALAGYVDYLRRTGQYEDYKERVQRQRTENEKILTDFRENTPGLEKVIAVVENDKKESSLYCVIEGERGAGKREIVQKIALLLVQQDKIDSADYQNIDMYSLSGSRSLFGRFSEFEKRKLYVLTDLKEFLHNSREAVSGDGSEISHLIKILGRYQPETYIIVVGEKKHIDQFIMLTPQIKFLFGNSIISIKDLTPETLYGIFAEKLSASLKEQLNDDKGFRRRFLDYVAMNRKLLPLDNRELADYLADYANNRKALTLPPEVYSKQTTKEMLQAVIGMDNVKKTAYEFEKYALFTKRAESEGMTLPNSSLHMIFTGNPGTGKTMVARIIGQMLFNLGIVAENKVIEVESKDLKGEYIGQSALKTTDVINKAMGGVLFIDEAYSIGSDSFSKDIIATLIKAMEDHRDNLVVIFAGYEKEMHDFLNTNSGIASRIGYTFHFDDYTADELTRMFDMKMKKAGFEYDCEILDTVNEICRHFIRKKNYGNGRFIDKLMQRVILKHSSRETVSDSVKLITAEDIPSEEEMVSTDAAERNDYETQLKMFIGMENVKEKVRKFARFVEFQQLAKKAGADIPAGNMHMIFAGNPGTGKTAIARIMADVLYEIGVIRKNKLTEVERKDLVSAHVGHTAKKTNDVIEMALDGILFIDEAYTLTPKDPGNDFGPEAIATLIKAMEDHRDDLIVIFAGYKDEMRQFVNANPGIASRIGYTFDFEDYTTSELLQMYRNKMSESGFSVSDKALEKVRIVTEYFSKKKNFGNGRFISKLQQETLLLHSEHIDEDKTNLLKISAADIPDISDINNTAKRPERSPDLEQIIGMTAVKQKLKEFENTVNFGIAAKEYGLAVPNFNMHMIFTGNPGTGKTTIARIIARKLYDIGVIAENKLVEVERKDLVAGYVGQTAIKTGEIIEKAMGGILFIDEAYTLTPSSESDFGGESIATLIRAMENHRDDLIVIFAGYEEAMKKFTDANPGIASRIGFTFRFEDYDAEELTQIFTDKLTAGKFSVTEAAQNKVKKLMQYFCHVRNFGNGRFADKVIQNTLALHAKNYRPETVDIIDEDDIPDIKEIADTMGRSHSMIMSDDVSGEEHRRIAIHESGHALVQCKLFPNSTIRKITTAVEGTGALGYVEHESDFGVQNTKTVYQNAIAVLMAGLAAERVLLGDYADGGSGDIKAASERAHVMVTQCGMSKHGFVKGGNDTEIWQEINEIVKEGFDHATQIIEANVSCVDKMAELLLTKGDMTDADVRSLLSEKAAAV